MKNTKLWNKNFSLLVIGQIMSLFGNMIITAVLPLHILNISGSPFLFGLAMGLPVISFVIMTPIGGVMADRIKKHQLMFWLDISITVIIVLYMLVSGFFAEIVPIVIVKLLAFNAIQSVYMATTASSISALVPTEKLTAGNAIIQVVNMLSMTGGMALAGLLYDRLGLTPILIGTIICFVLTAIADLFIRIPCKEQKSSGNIFQILKSDIVEALRFIFKDKPVLSKCFVPMFLVEFVFSSMLMVGLPVLIIGYFGMTMTMVGIALAFMMFGGVVGGIIAGILGNKLTVTRGFLFVLVSGFLSILMGTIFFFNLPTIVSFIVIVFAGTLFTLSAKVAGIALMSYIQKETPIELLGKTLSILMVIPFVAQSLAYPFHGWLFGRFISSPGLIIMTCATLLIITILFAYRYFKKVL